MRQVLRLFSELPGSRSFYLTGGTALSDFYLHHRLSFDLDLFSPLRSKKVNPSIVSEMSERTADALKASGMNVKWLQNHQQCGEMIVAKKEQQTRVTLAFDTAPLLKPARKKYMNVAVASFEDAASSKLCALLERLEHRDILDVYFILKKIKSEKLIALARKRWNYIDPYKLAQLFSRIEMIMPSLSAFQGFLMQKNLQREQIASFYKKESENILSHLLGGR